VPCIPEFHCEGLKVAVGPSQTICLLDATAAKIESQNVLLQQADPIAWDCRWSLGCKAQAMREEPVPRTFVDLPGPVLAQIARLGKNGYYRYPLFTLSRGCRDAYLTNAGRISLDLAGASVEPAEQSCQPQARLLDRACRQAPPGLHLSVRLGQAHSQALLHLLQPVISNGGYSAVHELEVGNSSSSRSSRQL
jgi:hypothetical protein